MSDNNEVNTVLHHQFVPDPRWSPNVGDEPLCVRCLLPADAAVHPPPLSSEGEILDHLADALVENGMRLATPEETQALVDHAVTHVMEQEELLRSTEVTRTVDGKPEVPRSYAELGAAIEAMVRDVNDPTVAYGPNRDGYGKCVEVMWRAAYMAMQTVAYDLGVTGFQHSIACGEAYRALADIEGPFLVVRLQQALYPQYDLPGRVAEAIEESRDWLRDEARRLLARDVAHVHPDVVARWRKYAEEES